MFGTKQSERVHRLEATMAVWRQAFTGEPFEQKGLNYPGDAEASPADGARLADRRRDGSVCETGSAYRRRLLPVGGPRERCGAAQGLFDEEKRWVRSPVPPSW